MKKTLLLLLFTAFAALSSRADVIFQEPFNYANGNITNVSNNIWTNFSGSGLHDMLVNNHHLEVSTTGNAITSRADDDYHSFSQTNGSYYTNNELVVYASFTVICTNLPNGPGSYFGSFYNTGKGYCGRVQAFTNYTLLPNTWRLGVTGNTLSTNAAGGGYPVDLALNTPYTVVEELDPINLQAATIWVNPTDINQTGGGGATETHYTSGDGFGFATTFPVNAYAFRQASSFGNGFWIITNLVVSTTFGDAYTNVVSTNAVAPVVVYQPILGVTNFTGSTFSISAVVNGQGLGNMTYQWQLNGVNYSGEASANGNILTFNSAAIADNGNYTLIATTPYGLSVTSSISKILISSAPVPPTFITEPVSQTVYVGANVTFSTTVNSPGSIFYQWKSNGVDIVGANSSTYTLNSVQTVDAASYSVGVTNNVVTTGIVSTNAVLTVVPPQQVTIAYLRTLVDPTTFAATNVPATIPYQVTGIVTTTNLTSGDTAGYYLQDATAGINMFVTGGSGFRPNPGDKVTFVGVVSTFSANTGGLELDADSTAGTTLPYTSYSIIGNNFPLPAPISIPFSLTNTVPIAYIATNIEGSRVTLSDVYFGTSAGSILSSNANTTVAVTNSAGLKFNLYFYDLGTSNANSTLPAYAYKVTGILNGAPPNFYLGVVNFADVVTSLPVAIPLTITSTGNTLNFSWSDSSFVLQSSTNVAGPYVTIVGAASGFSTNVTITVPTQFYRLFHQ